MSRIFLYLLALFLAAKFSAATLTVHAASSLTDAIKEIAASYERSTGEKVRLNFGASSFLERQIEEGAPGDVFLSADEAKMDALETAGLLAPGTRSTLLRNSLVIVIPSDSNLQIDSAADLAIDRIKKIAISEPSAVPVGIYSKEYLTKKGLWEKIAGKIVPTENVRASLAAVASGNVEAGFVYKTDLLISKRVKLAFEVPATEGLRITFPVAVLASSKNFEGAKGFVTFLKSAAAEAVFTKYGFTIAAR